MYQIRLAQVRDPEIDLPLRASSGTFFALQDLSCILVDHAPPDSAPCFDCLRGVVPIHAAKSTLRLKIPVLLGVRARARHRPCLGA